MSISKIEAFEEERRKSIEEMVSDPEVVEASRNWFDKTYKYNYSYNFSWMGRPVIQYPQDIVAMQEIIWEVKPDIIIETGVAHGGSLILYASLLHLLGGNGKVLGIDIDIRPHNRAAIEAHPMFNRIKLLQGSSIEQAIVDEARDFAADGKTVMVVLDSNHTEEHVLRELELYSPLVTKGSYLVVFDTIVEDMPENAFPNRPWGRGDNPKTAVHKFLQSNGRFQIDTNIHNKLQITVAPDGYLKCLRD